MFLMTLACSITLGDTPPPQTRKAGRPSGSSGARSLRSSDRGKSPTPASPPKGKSPTPVSPPQSPEGYLAHKEPPPSQRPP
ncbi:hypothetical protein T484DRAFT_1792834 [Baffinella frigidus]|nr:hypothetical protein T484DRAFT_1792834 [Cryptophyta sp. CCMP2293]